MRHVCRLPKIPAYSITSDIAVLNPNHHPILFFAGLYFQRMPETVFCLATDPLPCHIKPDSVAGFHLLIWRRKGCDGAQTGDIKFLPPPFNQDFFGSECVVSLQAFFKFLIISFKFGAALSLTITGVLAGFLVKKKISVTSQPDAKNTETHIQIL